MQQTREELSRFLKRDVSEAEYKRLRAADRAEAISHHRPSMPVPDEEIYKRWPGAGMAQWQRRGRRPRPFGEWPYDMDLSNV
jgi:hypothetical protein